MIKNNRKGRPRKIDTGILINIIHEYHKQYPEELLRATKLAKYAGKFQLKVHYQDFTRNEQLTQLIKEINNKTKWELIKQTNMSTFNTLPEGEVSSRLKKILNDSTTSEYVKDTITLINNERVLAINTVSELEDKVAALKARNIILSRENKNKKDT